MYNNPLRICVSAACLYLLQAPAHADTKLSAADVYRLRAPAVFQIEVPDFAHKVIMGGSAVAVSADELVTNKHVAAFGPTLKVKQGNKTWTATITHVLPDEDLVKLKVQGLKLANFAPCRLGKLTVGEPVYAIGAPKGLEQSLSEGIVSAVRTEHNVDYIQSTASQSHGSSGGGLFDSSARLVGITTLSLHSASEIHFALPAALVAELDSHPVKNDPPCGSRAFVAELNYQMGEAALARTPFIDVGKALGYFKMSYEIEPTAKAASKEAYCYAHATTSAQGAQGVRVRQHIAEQERMWNQRALVPNQNNASNREALGKADEPVGAHSAAADRAPQPTNLATQHNPASTNSAERAAKIANIFALLRNRNRE